MALKIEHLQRLDLGIQGEHNATVIYIDCSSWKTQYPNGTISLYHQRHGDAEMGVTGATYNSETGILSWSVTSTDTNYEGDGMAEIRLTDGYVVKKIKKALTIVFPAVISSTGSTISSNMQAYINEMERIKGTLASEAEAWAVGKRNNVDVTSDDPTYHNNSKYYLGLIQAAEEILEDLIPEDLDDYTTGASVTSRLAAFGYIDGTTLVLEEPSE